MKLTREYIDTITPKHGRTSCDDAYVVNGHYDIVEQELKGVVVERTIERHPRCMRCFLLTQLNDNDGELDPRIQLRLLVTIEPIQPEFEIIPIKK